MKIFDQKFRFLIIENRYSMNVDLIDHYKYNFRFLWPQKISIFQILLTTKYNIISMIKEMPLTFLDVKN